MYEYMYIYICVYIYIGIYHFFVTYDVFRQCQWNAREADDGNVSLHAAAAGVHKEVAATQGVAQ